MIFDGQFVERIDQLVWGPALILCFLGVGIFLTISTRFAVWRNLRWALKSIFKSEQQKEQQIKGDISSIAAFLTSLAAALGTGNIIGVATAMSLGGTGALVWMWISAAIGMTLNYAECMLAVKYRKKNDEGEFLGGPMYTMKHAFHMEKVQKIMGVLFCIFAVGASLGVGNMAQANAAANAMQDGFGISKSWAGILLSGLILLVVSGGIQSIAKVTEKMVPVMGFFYMVACIFGVFCYRENIVSQMRAMFYQAFSIQSVGGAAGGVFTISMFRALRWGLVRGIASNEAGIGSSAITAAAAKTKSPSDQGYLHMTGVFFDTFVVCTATGLLLLACKADSVAIAFTKVYGSWGKRALALAMILFAFASMAGWEYQGEKAFEFLTKDSFYGVVYRVVFVIIVYLGARMSLTTVWAIADIMNGLMAVPNLLCLWKMRNVIKQETFLDERKRNEG